MSTVLSSSVPYNDVMTSRKKHPSIRKCLPRVYPLWREPLSQRHINTYFEQYILPELSARLEGAFEAIPEFDREDAVQDATCQALVVFRELILYDICRKSTALGDVAAALAKYTSRRYLAGIRFATPRSTTSL